MHNRGIPFLRLLLLACVPLLVLYPLIPLLPASADFVAVEETLRRVYEIESTVSCNLDDSRLGEVFINDWRGGDIAPQDMMLVRQFGPQTPNGFSGVLAVKRAYYAYLRQVKERYTQARASGNYPATTAPFQIPEINAFMDTVGRPVNYLPEEVCLANLTLPRFTIESMRTTLFRDVVIAVVEGQHYTSEFVFIRVNQRWYFAGGKTIRMHAG